MGRDREIGEGQRYGRDIERLGRDSLGQTETDREETAGDRGETERLGSDREIGKRPRYRGGTEIGKRQREIGEKPRERRGTEMGKRLREIGDRPKR